MHEYMYAKMCKFWCLLVYMEEGIQLWSGIQNTVYACRRFTEGGKPAKGFQNKQH